MKTIYINPKTQSFSFAPQSMQMTSPFANPEGEGGEPKTERLC